MAKEVSSGMSAWFSLEGQNLYYRHFENQTDKSDFCCLCVRVWGRFNHLGLMGLRLQRKLLQVQRPFLVVVTFEPCKVSWHFLALLPLAGSWRSHGSSAGGGGLLTYFSLNFLYVVFVPGVFLPEQLPREGFWAQYELVHGKHNTQALSWALLFQ